MKARWAPWLFLLICAILPFASTLFSGKVLGPTEHIQTMITPDAPAPSTGWDVLQADGVLQFLPWRDLVFDSWRSFQVPILNPYQLAGQPLTANSQSGGFYPLHILFAFLPITTGMKIVLLAILHGFIGAMGMRALLKNFEVSEAGSLLGGAAFAMSQFMIAWSPLASVTTTVAWIPWLLFGITAHDKRGSFFGCGFGLSMMLLGGHLQFAAYGLMAMTVALIFKLVGKDRALVAPVLLGLIAGGLIAAPQVRLVLQNSQTSHRKNVPTPDGYKAYQNGALAPFEALSLVHPKLLGDTQLKSEELTNSKVPNAYWPMFAKLGSNPAECALWLSPVALCLALLAFADRERRKWVLAGVLVLLGGLLAFGSPLNQLLYFNAPGWSATGSPGRALVLIVLGIAMLAGVGYDAFSRMDAQPKKKLAIAIAPLILLAIGMNGQRMAISSLSQPGDETLSKIASMATQPAMPIISLCALLAAGGLAAIASGKLKPEWSFAPAALAILPMLTLAPVSGPDLKLPTELINRGWRFAFQSEGWSMVSTPKATMPPNIASLARSPDLFGYDSLLDGAFVNKLKEALGSEPSPPENGNMLLYRGDDIDHLHELGVGSGRYHEANPRIDGGRFKEDGYDHQTVQPSEGAEEILIRDRYYEGMTVNAPAKIFNEDGWRKIVLNGATGDITIHYPGRNNAFIVIIGCILLSISFVLSKGKA